ncbi:DNA methyltransferase [Novosphingobium rosa]|uniref:DNA methyltransferase n=1 Tax=Novosphingobium rosa TaxID=76978 RepID=UPI000835B77A|nr:DNA methyltransferase [Novosphingobium rosa]
MTAIIIGPAILYLGDAYTIRPTLGWMDADVMDPQYRFNNSGGGAYRAARGASDQIVAEGLDRGFDHSIIDPALAGAVIVFCHNDQLGDLIPDLVEDESADFDALLVADMFARLKRRFHRAALCVWIKQNPAPHRNKHYLADMEPYIHAWNPGYHPVGDHHDMHRWHTATSMPSKTFSHPTVKPLSLMAKIMANVAGETVCDPFMGTGSTGVAALRAGKRFYGIEKNPQHFETAVARISAAWAEIEQRCA